MIKISFNKNAEGIYNGFVSAGHAGYAENGRDIICAAVSALVINTINSVESFTSDQYDVRTCEEDGVIEFQILSKHISSQSQLLLNSLILGLEGIQKDNGKKYIKIKK